MKPRVYTKNKYFREPVLKNMLRVHIRKQSSFVVYTKIKQFRGPVLENYGVSDTSLRANFPPTNIRGTFFPQQKERGGAQTNVSYATRHETIVIQN